MARHSGLLPARVLFLGFEVRERGRLTSALGPYGYACVGTTIDDACDASGQPRFDVAILDARAMPRKSLALADRLRSMVPGIALVVVANMTDSFVYRHLAPIRRAVVLYAPVSPPHLQDALDRLTGGPHWGRPEDRVLASRNIA